MALFDDFFRFGAIGLFFWLTILVIRDYRHRIQGRLAAATSICMMAYLLCSKPGLAIATLDIDLFLFPFCVTGSIITWLFCLSQFDDHFEMKPWHWFVVAAKLGFGFLFFFDDIKQPTSLFLVGAWVSSTIAVGTLLHLIYVTWKGREDDLMPARLAFRSVFVAAVIVISLGILLAELWLVAYGTGAEDYLLLLQSSSFFAITIFVLWRISGPDGIELFAFSGTAETQTSVKLEAADQHDLSALTEKMGQGAYLEPGLSIAKLAASIAMPEHRLRRIINQQLGFRNFSDFLNHHRVEAAQARLASPEERHVPVLTIAMEVGYGSLGPFNRAFKERTGQTPSEFRRARLETRDQSAGMSGR